MAPYLYHSVPASSNHSPSSPVGKYHVLNLYFRGSKDLRQKDSPTHFSVHHRIEEQLVYIGFQNVKLYIRKVLAPFTTLRAARSQIVRHIAQHGATYYSVLGYAVYALLNSCSFHALLTWISTINILHRTFKAPDSIFVRVYSRNHQPHPNASLTRSLSAYKTALDPKGNRNPKGDPSEKMQSSAVPPTQVHQRSLMSPQ